MKDLTLYILRGLPGSGKSTLGEALAPHYNVAADDYPGLYVDGKYDRDLQKLSHQWCLQKAEIWMLEQQQKIAVHNTFSDPKYIEPYLEKAELYGYATQIIHCEAVVLGDSTRAQSVHDVPTETINRMRSAWKPFNQVEEAPNKPAKEDKDFVTIDLAKVPPGFRLTIDTEDTSNLAYFVDVRVRDGSAIEWKRIGRIADNYRGDIFAYVPPSYPSQRFGYWGNSQDWAFDRLLERANLTRQDILTAQPTEPNFGKVPVLTINLRDVPEGFRLTVDEENQAGVFCSVEIKVIDEVSRIPEWKKIGKLIDNRQGSLFVVNQRVHGIRAESQEWALGRLLYWSKYAGTDIIDAASLDPQHSQQILEDGDTDLTPTPAKTDKQGILQKILDFLFEIGIHFEIEGNVDFLDVSKFRGMHNKTDNKGLLVINPESATYDILRCAAQLALMPTPASSFTCIDVEHYHSHELAEHEAWIYAAYQHIGISVSEYKGVLTTLDIQLPSKDGILRLEELGLTTVAMYPKMNTWLAP